MCVSCRKSKTVTGPRVRASTSFRPSGVNSPLPDARRSCNPSIAGGASLVPGLRGSSVVRQFRCRSLTSFRSMSQINTGVSGERTGLLFCARSEARRLRGQRTKANAKPPARDECVRKFVRAVVNAAEWEVMIGARAGPQWFVESLRDEAQLYRGLSRASTTGQSATR